MRLIDADMLKNVVGEHSEVRKIICKILDLMPTVEAVPVVSGEWETVPNKIVEHGEVETRGTAERCSNCFHASPDFKKHMNFCPNCGARMVKDNE